MLIGTECVQLTKQEVRGIVLPILDTLFHAQVALAAKDRESEKTAARNGEKYNSLCYWDARDRFDPFVEYVAHVVVELTTGWFWPEEDEKGNVVDSLLSGEHGVPCRFATFYHKEIATKILGYADDIREFYEGSPLEGVWKRFDREIREAVARYQKLVKNGERYEYGIVKIKKPKKGKNNDKSQK